MSVLRLSFLLLAGALVMYGVLYSVFSLGRYMVAPLARAGSIDTYLAKNDPCIYHDAQTVILYKRRLFRSDKPKLIILGGSSSRDGFRPEELKSEFEAYDPHNLAFSSANASQMLETVKFLNDTSSAGSFKDSIFVFGMFSGALVSNQGRKWDQNGGPFPAQIRYLGGYEKNEAGAYRPRFSDAFSQVGLAANMPMYCLASSMRKGIKGLSKFVRGLVEAAEEKEFNREKLLRSMARKIGGGPKAYNEQYAALQEMQKLIESMGARLVLAEIPVARWYRERSDEAKAFERFFEEIERDGEITSVSLNSGFTDDMFRDHAHPVMTTTHLWSEKLHESLEKLDVIP